MLSFWKIVWAPNHRKRRRRSKKVNSWSLLRKPKFLCQGLENNRFLRKSLLPTLRRLESLIKN